MDETNLEVLPPSAVQALEAAQIDCQISTAKRYPRSLEMFKKRAMDMVQIDLQTAESCIYERPVGDGKTATGESIRMAEIVASCYGNLRVASRIVEQTPRFVRCEGVAHDLESNYAGKSECMEPTVKRNGEPYSEAQRAVVAKACLAKAYRDAVFKVVPKALCKTITEKAYAVINKEVATLDQRIDRVKKWLRGINVEDSRVMGVLGVKGWADVTDEHLIRLTGLRTAINDQETTVAEAFPSPIVPPTKKESAASAKSELFPDGQKSKLDELTAKLTPEITEAFLLDYMRARDIVDDSLSSLKEIFSIKPAAIELVLNTWPEVVKAHKVSKTPPKK